MTMNSMRLVSRELAKIGGGRRLHCIVKLSKGLWVVQNPQFLGSVNEVDQQGFANAWGDAVDGRMPPPLLHRDAMPQFAEFERIYGQAPVSATPQLFNLDG